MPKLGEGMNRTGLEIIFEGKRLSYITLPLPPPIKGGGISVI
jgi:hypothetical protein